MMKNDASVYANTTEIENIESLGQRQRDAKMNHHSRVDSIRQATSSRVILEHALCDKSTIHAYFQQRHGTETWEFTNEGRTI